jgi:DNA-binding transcriptional LysR family regulator
MRWEDVQTVLAVARGGSLAAAGRTLGVAPSTVWRRIEAIQAATATRLFEPDDGWALTAAGEAVLPLAEAVEADMLALDRAVAAHDARPAGVVRLTAAEALLPLLSGPLVAFREANPAIVVQGLFTDQMLDLGRREADVAVRPTMAPPDAALGRRVATVAWAVYGPASVGREGSDRLPWAVYTDALAGLAAARWHREEHGDGAPLMEVNTVPAMQCVVGTARCRGLLPCFVGDADARLQRLEGPIAAAASSLWVLSHADLRRTARVRLLVEHLVAALEAVRSRFEG